MSLIHFNRATVNREDMTPGYLALLDAFRVPLLDRTRTLNKGFDYAIVDPIPALSATFAKTFAECCDERAQQLLALDRPLHVFWSGGIDSTVALTALIRNSTSEQRAKNLFVRLNYASELEYPRFYANHIEGKLNEIRIEGETCDGLSSDVVNVTGECGDQIFGSVLIERFIRSESFGGQPFTPAVLGDLPADYAHSPRLLFEEPWEKWLRPYITEKLAGDRERAELALATLRPVMLKAPFEISNGFEAFWWINFNFKWQDVSLRFIVNGDVSRELFDSVHHFFRTENFQQWSMQKENQRLKIKQMPEGWSMWRTYKWTAKEYIADFTGDREYAEGKRKVGSLQSRIDESYVHLTNDFVKVTI